MTSNGKLQEEDPPRKPRNAKALTRALDGSWSGTKGTACCPAHRDRRASLSIAQKGEKILVKCHTGCSQDQIIAALRDRGLWPEARPRGVTIEQYAEAKKLPEDFLCEQGLEDTFINGTQAIRVPYFDAAGEEIAIRFRISLDGSDKFRWRRGNKAVLYGQKRLSEARENGSITIVEGESDCHTLWFEGFPAIGLPGAASWKEERDAPLFDGIATINVVIEPDNGGEAVRRWVSASKIKDRVRLVTLDGFKDPSSLYIDNPGRFAERFQTALDAAVPWLDDAARKAAAARDAAWEQCRELAERIDILDDAVDVLHRLGLVRETRNAKLLYLVITSRLLPRIVSVKVTGPSSGGKSYLAQKVLTLFPPEAAYTATAMSERALIYDQTPLQHRMLCIYEAAGIGSDFLSYLIRSLLSEGCVRYLTLEKVNGVIKPREIVREGPTGLITTTTAIKLHAENETRLLSLTVTDTQHQTADILRAQAAAAAKHERERVDLRPWHALQNYLALGPAEVVVPFAPALAEKTAPVAVRLRRDFAAVLSLIEAHALLHSASRKRDAEGRIVATLGDYKVVRGLVAPIIAEGVEATVPDAVREVVEAVRDRDERGEEGVKVQALARLLKLDKSAITRRVNKAIEAGFLRNLETRKGQAMRLVRDEPMPDDAKVLPPASDLEDTPKATPGFRSRGRERKDVRE